MDIIELGRRREFTDAVRLRIVEESYSAPRLASATARKYGLSRSQLNTWRRAYREGRLAIGDFDGFVPALVVAEAPMPAPVPLNSPSSTGRMEIVIANGRRVVVDRDVDLDALLRIVRGLERLE
ncbi:MULTISPECIES: transposase [unclassified Shinella]|uniref:IS66-like element accessory protein TnpA n=1 Tax=unclassified Shinella TaxID=2643062 RepID=UPI00041DAFC6|nr:MULTISPECIES: transposase [unclassified Shinella]